MPMPKEYATASRDFDAFLSDAKDALDALSTNTAYTTVQSVLIIFRRRLTIAQAINFAGVLPPVLRAIFVSNWNVNEPALPFTDLGSLNQEVKTIRRSHNFSPDRSIEPVSSVLWKYVDARRFASTLEEISPDAISFWVEGSSGAG